MTFKIDDPDVILIGGEANDAAGALYAVTVMRGAGNHITGFSGSATLSSTAAYGDGGVAYGPGNVLFLARWPNNELGQVKPGSAVTNKVIDLAALGVSGSPGGLNFVPQGFPGAGQMKLASYDDGTWYTASLSPDGTGTFNVTGVTQNTTIVGGPEGFTYVPPGSPVFPPNSMLQAEYGNDLVSTYQLDASGNPIVATRQEFITGLTGAEGAVIDPTTGDFLFSTFGGGDRIIVVKGFVPPPTNSPTPSPSPSPTPTPSPSETPSPTPTPTASPTPTATATETATATASPSPTATTPSGLTEGDADCRPPVNSIDALQLLLFVAHLQTNVADGCPDIGTLLAAFGVTWGDLNCDGHADSLDALTLLLWLAHLPYNVGTCPDIGTAL
jgi:hypothetical protein